jgi:phage FluMu protein Com
VQEVKCPKCGAMNLVWCELSEEVIVMLKDEKSSKEPLKEPELKKR